MSALPPPTAPATIRGIHFDHPPMGRSAAIATMSDGTTVELFTYYRDEIGFTSEELIGLTAAEAGRLRHQRDISYLQSE